MVLGINNRTENWKTALEFAPYFSEPHSLLKLAKHLGETDDIEPCEVHIELFWKGVRDYLHSIKDRDKRGCRREELLANSKKMLSDVRRRILSFGDLRDLKEHNYSAAPPESKKLLNNLYNTEIDIVMETPKSLFIGEAKHEASFGADSRLVLVHQLIRQYVMANALLETLGCKKQIVPFVVGDDAADLKKKQQVRFMIDQQWLDECNVLDWNKIASLREKSGPDC